MTAEERLAGAIQITREWASLTGHSRCFNSEEYLRRIAHQLSVPVEPAPTVELCEFADGCERFQRFTFGDAAVTEMLANRCRGGGGQEPT